MKIILGLLALLSLGSLNADEMITWNKSILKPYCKEVAKIRDWRVVSQGEGYRVNEHGQRVQKILLGFACSQPLSICEARCLFVDEAENIIFLINKHSKQKGFCALELRLSLSLYDTNNTYVSPDLAFMFMWDGKIFYNKRNEETGELETCCEESYEDALRIVQEEQAHKAAEGTVKKKRKYAKNG